MQLANIGTSCLLPGWKFVFFNINSSVNEEAEDLWYSFSILFSAKTDAEKPNLLYNKVPGNKKIIDLAFLMLTWMLFFWPISFM